jgi:hypothetical protein
VTLAPVAAEAAAAEFFSAQIAAAAEVKAAVAAPAEASEKAF